MEKLHHYTSIENLSLILKSKKIRFTRLDKVDDIKEIDGFPEWFSTYIYISSWTHESKEDISLWKMYTPNMRGVRITFPIEMFRKNLIEGGNGKTHLFAKNVYSPLIFEELFTDKYFVLSTLEYEDNFYTKVIYDDNYPKIYMDCFNIGSKSKSVQINDIRSLGGI